MAGYKQKEGDLDYIPFFGPALFELYIVRLKTQLQWEANDTNSVTTFISLPCARSVILFDTRFSEKSNNSLVIVRSPASTAFDYIFCSLISFCYSCSGRVFTRANGVLIDQESKVLGRNTKHVIHGLNIAAVKQVKKDLL